MTSTASVEPASNQRFRFRADAAILVALAPLVAAAIRIWLFSGGDSALFLVLLRTIDIPAVLIGTTALIIPSALIWFALILLTDPKVRYRAHLWLSGNKWAPALIGPLVVALLVYTLPWPTIAGLGAIIACGIGYYLWRKVRKNSTSRVDGASRVGPDSLVSIVSVAAVFLVGPSSMWLPMERIEIAGSKPQTGYVLQTDDSWTTILTSKRVITILPTAKVRKRQVCSSRNPGTLAISMQDGGVHNAPVCK